MKNYYLMGLDTETANSIVANDKLDLTQSLVYDLGWNVIDNTGNTYVARSYVAREIFLDKELMNSAYYKEKIPRYWEQIENGTRVLTTFSQMRREFIRDYRYFRPKAVFAHNAMFDYKALNNTLRYLTGSKYRYFFPCQTEIWDTLKMSREAIGKTKEYTDFCDKNNFKTNHKKPQNRLTAEILYRYLSGNIDFEESHTGLEDVTIETQILLHCLKNNPEVKRLLFEK